MRKKHSGKPYAATMEWLVIYAASVTGQIFRPALNGSNWLRETAFFLKMAKLTLNHIIKDYLQLKLWEKLIWLWYPIIYAVEEKANFSVGLLCIIQHRN